MPLRNRVTPYGEIVAIPERGTLMGNRGLLHDDDGEHRRDWKVLRWIACELEFRGRRRPLRQPGRYTELFFLDEATALAAGHRPCAECRRADFDRWTAAWPHGDTKVAAMDAVLHASRLDGTAQRTHGAALGELPDGVIVERAGAPFLWSGGALRPWAAKGYGPPEAARAGDRVTVLTPAATVAVIANGYGVSTHRSAW
jgi:hypothetical protein